MAGKAVVLALRWLSALAGLAGGLLLLRLLFRLFIANPANPVTGLVDALSRPLLLPWAWLWPPAELPVLSLERAALLALAQYLVLSLALGLLARALERRKEVVG
ncbi:MAG: hypothetical protein ACP5OO_07995 [Chloroflexia bacterium]